MHLFGGTQDGVHRACLNTQRATDALGFIDDSNHLGFFNPVFRAQRLWIATEQIGQRYDRRLSAWWALVNVGFAAGNCGRVGTATGKAALTTLRLGKQRINFVDQRVAFDFESHRGKTQQQAEYQTHHAKDNNRADHLNLEPGWRTP
jgi:hypothetical protein